MRRVYFSCIYLTQPPEVSLVQNPVEPWTMSRFTQYLVHMEVLQLRFSHQHSKVEITGEHVEVQSVYSIRQNREKHMQMIHL